jgi:hypothetical protein
MSGRTALTLLRLRFCAPRADKTKASDAVLFLNINQDEPMHISENQYYILKDVYVISRLGGSGCLPQKDALIYSRQELSELLEEDYVNEVTLVKPCGGEIRGLKLTRRGEWLLRKLEAKYAVDMAKPGVSGSVVCLDPDLMDILWDIYHFCRLKRSGGLFPRKEAESYSQDDLEYLYLHGYILKIQMGTKSGKKEKGFVLSNKGEQVVRTTDEAA